MSEEHTFIGIPLAEKLYNTGIYYQKQLDLQTHFRQLVDPNDFHITLLFLGGCDTSVRRRIWEEVRQKSANIEKMSLTMRSLNFFGKQTQPRVVFFEPEDNFCLNRIAEDIQQTAYQHEFPTEKRLFKPHMTLAKKWRNKKTFWPKDYPSLPYTIEPVTITAERISLFRIHPGQTQKYEETDMIWLKEPERRK